MKRLTTDLTPEHARDGNFVAQWPQEQGDLPTCHELPQGLALTKKNSHDDVFSLNGLKRS